MTFWRGSWLQSEACHKCRLYDFDEIALDCVPGQVAWDLVGHVCISRCRVIQQSDGNISKIQYRTPSKNVSGGKTILDPRDFPTHRCLPSEKNKPCLKTRRYLIEPTDWSKEGVFTLHFYKQQVRDVNFSPNSSWAEWGSQFLLETAFVPSWFAGSSWFRLGFRCLSPFFFLLSFLRKGVLFHYDLLVPLGVGWGSGACLPSSLLSFLRKGVLFHHDLLVPLGSRWGSGACLPSSLFLFSSGKGFCSIMICWFLLVPAGVLVLVSLLLSSFLHQEKGSVHHGFPGSSFFWCRFRCLSPFFSFFLFSGKGFCSIMDFLVPPASGWGSGACHPSSSFVSPNSSWAEWGSQFLLETAFVPSWFAGSSSFRLEFRCLFPFFFLSSGKGFCSIMICWFLLVPAGVPVLVSFLLSSLVPVLVSLLLSSFFPQERGSVPSWFAGSSWFRLGFRCLSPFFSLLVFVRKGVLFHHDLLVWFRLGFRCLSPFFSLLSFLRKEVLFHHDLLFPLGSGWGSGAYLPFSLFFGSGACLISSLFFFSSGKGFCSIMICWFLLVPAGVLVLVSLFVSYLVPVLVSLLLSSVFPQDRDSVPSWFAGFLLVPAGVPVLVSLLLSSFLPQEKGSVHHGFPGSSFFWWGFRCLSPFFSLLVFVRKRVLVCSIMDFLVPPVSGWGSDACLPSSLFFLASGKGFCFIMDFLVLPASGWGSGACLLSLFSLFSSGKGFCSFMDFLVPPASGWGSGACLPSSLFFLFLIRVCQTFFKWMLNFAWPWWKHALLLFGIYAGVIWYLTYFDPSTNCLKRLVLPPITHLKNLF